MTIAAMLFAGAGGVGGYFFRGDNSSLSKDRATIKDLQARLAETGKLNRDLEEGLRSQHEAYQRVNQDLKLAEDQLKIQTSANPGKGANDDLQRELVPRRGHPAGQSEMESLMPFLTSKRHSAATEKRVETKSFRPFFVDIRRLPTTLRTPFPAASGV